MRRGRALGASGIGEIDDEAVLPRSRKIDFGEQPGIEQRAVQRAGELSTA